MATTVEKSDPVDFKSMTPAERKEALKGKRIQYDEPPRTTGCRLKRHNGLKGEGLVIEDNFRVCDCYVKTDEHGYRYFRYEYIKAVLD